MTKDSINIQFFNEFRDWVAEFKKYRDQITVTPIDELFCSLTYGQRSVTIMGSIYPLQRTAIGATMNCTLSLIFYFFDKPGEAQQNMILATNILQHYPDRVWHQDYPLLDQPPEITLDKIEALIWEHLQIQKPGE